MTDSRSARPEQILALESDLQRDGDALLVSFGGVGQAIGGIPPFEFRRMTERLRAKLVFVRDPYQAWYHDRIPGVGRGLEDLARTLQRVRDSAHASRLVCIGNSMGGYAALVVGSLLAADEVLSFVPQTFLSPWLRARYLDRRWPGDIARAQKSPTALREAFDLREYLRAPGYRHATAFADPAHRLDAAHLRRLDGLPRTLLRWEPGEHSLIKRLRDSGELAALVTQACEGARLTSTG